MRSARESATWAVAGLLALLLASPRASWAGDLYLTGTLGISGALADSKATIQFVPGTPSGDDSDAAAFYGGALGLSVPLHELVAPDLVELPEWPLRFEIEGVAGRDWRFATPAAPGERFFTRTSSWSVLAQLWLDVPVHPAISFLLGYRVPLLEPMTFYGGGGLGMAGIDTKTGDNVSSGKKDDLGFAWSVGGGTGYALTELVTIGVGYRFLDLGTQNVPLQNGGSPFGSFRLDLQVHEVVTGLRVLFYDLPGLADLRAR